MDVSQRNTPVVSHPVSSPMSSSTLQSQSPPPYQSPNENESLREDPINDSPPMYTDVVKLPSYNESENTSNGETHENPSVFLYWLRNSSDDNDVVVGSDLGFVLCFLLAFVFNWIGFLAGYCFSNSLSAQYGAVSGFGLSLVKWAFIVKHTEWSKEYFDDSPWLMYLFVLCGWLIFLRGMFSYAQLKRHVYSRLDDSENPRRQNLFH
ncbi:NEDD4 family-interacting protein 1-like isoform X2 [Hydra vulgaris]|uniref:NEDD4 family-interacting protein 1-like isoform X2 n=1 Tax=Hydra vulgaris TaxID=6087 RepID=A0ABM4D350_HYDVU